MSIGIGSFSDPIEAQGLAHFLGVCYVCTHSSSKDVLNVDVQTLLTNWKFCRTHAFHGEYRVSRWKWGLFVYECSFPIFGASSIGFYHLEMHMILGIIYDKRGLLRDWEYIHGNSKAAWIFPYYRLRHGISRIIFTHRFATASACLFYVCMSGRTC